MKKKLTIFGTGSHAKLALNEVLKNYKFDQIYFFNKKEKEKHLIVNKKKYLVYKSYFELNKKIKPNSFYFIAVGLNSLRKKIYEEIKTKLKKHKSFIIISKKSNIDKTVKIGEGTIILPGVSINYNTKIGKYSIINTNSSIDHDNIFGNFTSTGPGVNIAGNVIVKDLCQIGIGSSIKENIIIKKNTIIGGGSFVNRNCENNSVYFGVPAKKFIK